MRSIGIDLHKRSMTLCVIDKTTGETFVRRFRCCGQGQILEFFQAQAPFEAVVEASGTYEWLWVLLEPIAERLVLAHPGKVRIIAESKKKTDRFDAETLAGLLAADEVPEAHRPSPRQREYQQLVRHRVSLIRMRARLKVQIRSILAARNLDQPGIFRSLSPESVSALALSAAERFRVLELLSHLQFLDQRLESAQEELKRFRAQAPQADQDQHKIVTSVPGAGRVVADVVLSTLGDVRRFGSIQKVSAYAGLAPGFRESDNKRRDLGITKQGPKILRWVLIEAAWQSIRWSERWRSIFEAIARRRGRKKAIVAVARRLLGVIYTLLKKGQLYVEAASSTALLPRTPAPSKA